MKKFRLLIATLLCALTTTFVSCNFVSDAINNSITNTWVYSEDFGSYTIYYIYEFYYDDTYTYEEWQVNNNGGEKTNYYAYGTYDFSNYYETLTLFRNYPSYATIQMDAYISSGVLNLKELYDDGYYYWTRYYKN
ncbi:MAG: hypothetical protein SNG27_05195 [Rikenellaceae bacterium]